MAETKNCLVCGKEFKPCNTCVKGADELYRWRRVVCSREHFDYHLPIIEYIRGKITKTEARKELKQAIDTYGEIEFADNIKAVVKEILAEEKKSKKTKPVEEYVFETVETPVENIDVDIANTYEIIE